MKAIAFSLLILFIAIHCNAQTGTVGGPLSNHVWFNVTGARSNSGWGESSIDTLPGLSDSIPHPLAIGENLLGRTVEGTEFSSYILNRSENHAIDSAQFYAFPGTTIVPGNFNGDPYQDFVVINYTINHNNPIVTVLYGTAKPDSFITAAIIHVAPEVFANGNTEDLAVVDCNLDGYDDLILSERNYGLDIGNGQNFGKIDLFLGGPGMTMDTIPAQTLIGMNYLNPVGGRMRCGKIHDATHEYICEERGGSPSDQIATYLCRPDFQLLPTDTVWCADSGRADGGYLITEATGDSVDDILLGTGNSVLIYAGGKTISSVPTFAFTNEPFLTPDFGIILNNVGDISGHGYHYLLISVPSGNGYGGGVGGGDVFLFPMQKGLKDSCVGWAGLEDDAAGLGQTVAPVGDINGDGLADFYCGAAAPDGNNSTTYNTGRIVAFLGDTSYGTKVNAVNEPVIQPAILSLNQNYPNPFSWQTNISFSINDNRLWGKEATLKIYNALGEELFTAFNQKADGASYTIRVNAMGMPEGNYFYRLSCADMVTTKMFTILR